MTRALILSLGIFALGSCASNEPTIDRVRTVYVYEALPEEILQCFGPVRFTREELDAIDTEAEIAERITIPNFVRHMECLNNMDRVRNLNQTLSTEAAPNENSVE